MITRALGLLAVSVMLSGCFGTNDELWPVKSGERVTLLPEGGYNCTEYNNGVPSVTPRTVKSATEGANLYYIFTEPGIFGGSHETLGSFHKVLPDLYLLVTGGDGGGTFVAYVRFSEGHAVFIQPTDEQKDKYAKKHGVTMDGRGDIESGSPAQQRKFIIDLGENLEKSMMYDDCVPA